MEFQFTFQRTEKKYLLTAAQYRAITANLSERMHPDTFGRHTISSLYYDTPDFYLIRRSLEHPVYKEKLRLRGYADTPLVFPEIKKKYKGVVYKRRIACTPSQWQQLRDSQACIPGQSMQIQHELQQFWRQYPQLAPRVYIGYDRTAFLSDTDGLRITFDENLRARTSDLDLYAGSYGTPILSPGMVVMEVKFPGSAPLWLADLLSKQRLYPTSFSKYGRWFRQMCAGQWIELTDAVS